MCNIYDDNRHVTTKVILSALSQVDSCGKLFFKKDIEQFGSGNTGATNSFRVLGRPAGFLVTFLDIFKGFITVFFPLWLPVHADGLLVLLQMV